MLARVTKPLHNESVVIIYKLNKFIKLVSFFPRRTAFYIDTGYQIPIFFRSSLFFGSGIMNHV